MRGKDARCGVADPVFGRYGAWWKLPSREIWGKVREATFCVACNSPGALARMIGAETYNTRPARPPTAHDSSDCGKAFPTLAIDGGFGYAFGPK